MAGVAIDTVEDMKVRLLMAAVCTAVCSGGERSSAPSVSVCMLIDFVL